MAAFHLGFLATNHGRESFWPVCFEDLSKYSMGRTGEALFVRSRKMAYDGSTTCGDGEKEDPLAVARVDEYSKIRRHQVICPRSHWR
jgi:hypothetical protein